MEIKLISQNEFKTFQNEINEKLEKLINLFDAKSTEKKWIKSGEVQKHYQISPGKLQYMRDSGELPYSKIMGTCYYLQSDIEKILENNKVQ